MNKNFVSFGILIVCSGLFGWGFISFEKFNFTPGSQAMAPARFPATVETTYLHSQQPTLLVFIHPKCACTRATLAELSKLMAKTGGKLAAEVFIAVEESETEQEVIAAEERVRDVGDVRVARDLNGIMAKKFGAETSGQTYLYSPQGDLIFQGGITGSRGHQGDNVGSNEILNLVAQNNQHEKINGLVPTFGCKL